MPASQFKLIFGVIGWWAKSEFAISYKSLKQAGQESPILFFLFTQGLQLQLPLGFEFIPGNSPADVEW